MKPQDKQQQPNREHIEGSNDSKLPNTDPAKKQTPGTISKNPNPRANENLNSPEVTPDEERTNQAGSEITDGEDG
jgi:hypothetical protein